MTYIDRDSQGLLAPSSITNPMTTYHFLVADWDELFTEIGFVEEEVDRHYHLYKHTNDPNLRLRFDSKISQIALFKADEKLAYVYPSTFNTLSHAIENLLKTIRGLYETHH